MQQPKGVTLSLFSTSMTAVGYDNTMMYAGGKGAVDFHTTSVEKALNVARYAKFEADIPIILAWCMRKVCRQ
jgi:hypothetical protein